jgi:methionyl aminopeptidase
MLEGEEDGGGDDDDDDDDDDDNDKLGDDLNTEHQPIKKKRRRKKNKKAKQKKFAHGQQTIPPRMELASLFPNHQYPEGEIVEYATTDSHNHSRTTAQELRHLSAVRNMDDEFLRDYRQAAEVHRQVRQHVQRIAKPGVTMSHIAQEVEDGVRALSGHPGLEPGDSLKAGMGFPTGLCLNHVAAHWTPNPGGKEIVLQYDDVLKVDFGVHVNGRIVDSAFTVAANPVYDNLLEAVRAATNTGIKVSSSQVTPHSSEIDSSESSSSVLGSRH